MTHTNENSPGAPTPGESYRKTNALTARGFSHFLNLFSQVLNKIIGIRIRLIPTWPLNDHRNSPSHQDIKRGARVITKNDPPETTLGLKNQLDLNLLVLNELHRASQNPISNTDRTHQYVLSTPEAAFKIFKAVNRFRHLHSPPSTQPPKHNHPTEADRVAQQRAGKDET